MVGQQACKISQKMDSGLISYVHHTNDFRQCCHVGNTAQHCRLGLFQDTDFAGDHEDSKSTSGGVLCILGSRTSVPQEETFPIPLKYIDVTRTAHTNLCCKKGVSTTIGMLTEVDPCPIHGQVHVVE